MSSPSAWSGSHSLPRVRLRTAAPAPWIGVLQRVVSLLFSPGRNRRNPERRIVMGAKPEAASAAPALAAALRATAGYMFPNDTAQQCYDRILAIADELDELS